MGIQPSRQAVFAMIILGRVTLPLRALLANLCGIDHKGARAPLTPLAWAKNFQVVECVVRLFGILNITEDSFSDGGLYLAPHRALEHARSLIAAGADVVDVGPASSHPDSTPVSSATQIDRLRPILASVSPTALMEPGMIGLMEPGEPGDFAFLDGVIFWSFVTLFFSRIVYRSGPVLASGNFCRRGSTGRRCA